MYKCDVCDVESEQVVAGRWIFYCPEHEHVDKKKTYENEVAPSLDSGDLDYLLDDEDLVNAVLDLC